MVYGLDYFMVKGWFDCFDEVCAVIILLLRIECIIFVGWYY